MIDKVADIHFGTPPPPPLSGLGFSPSVHVDRLLVWLPSLDFGSCDLGATLSLRAVNPFKTLFYQRSFLFFEPQYMEAVLVGGGGSRTPSECCRGTFEQGTEPPPTHPGVYS